MRSSLRLTSIVALACGLSAACVVGCGGSGGTSEETPDTEVPDTSTDTGVAEVEIDSTLPDTTVEETDTGVVDTGEVDTGLLDTGEVDTGMVDTGEVDTGLVDTGEVDTGMVDTGLVDTGLVDTGLVDTGIVDLGSCEVGGACDDGNACTIGETYNSSCVCVGGTAKSCDDSNACTADSCNPTSGCAHAATGEGTSCAPGKKCNLGVCDTVCTPGTTCTDGNACTTGEKLNDACVCTGGTTVTCNDDNVCTTDTCSTTTGCVYTPVAEDTACGGTNKCKAGVCTSVTPPTVTFAAPVDNLAQSYVTSKTCQSIEFKVTWTAAQGFRDMRWDFIPPTSTSVGGGALKGGGCGYPLVYNYYMASTVYDGRTSGTFSEYVATAGEYSGSAGAGRWLWCVEPGSTSPETAVVSRTAPEFTAPYPPASPSVMTLSDYCYYTKGGGGTAPPTTDTLSQWTVRVTLTDKSGASAVATKKFWLYQ
ncbi:MAG: hypothetical protein HYV09_10310 [Deltaproteobacteria bacterium]|nr:hypothetical protein [Deltaproteobacteria bacterium]